MTLYLRRTSSLTQAVSPSAPLPPTLTAGSTQISAVWTAPASDGGSAITSYDLRYSVADAETWTTLTGRTSPSTITGLTNGTSYDVQVRGVNAAGNGEWSISSTVAPAAAVTLDYRSSTSSSIPVGTSMVVPAGAVAGNSLIFLSSYGQDQATSGPVAPALAETIPGFPTAGQPAGYSSFRGWWIPSWNGTTTSYNFGDQSANGERIIICLNGTASDVIGGQIRHLLGTSLAWHEMVMNANDIAIGIASQRDPADTPVTSFDSSWTRIKAQGPTNWIGMTNWVKRITAGAFVIPNPAGTTPQANNTTQLIRIIP